MKPAIHMRYGPFVSCGKIDRPGLVLWEDTPNWTDDINKVTCKDCVTALADLTARKLGGPIVHLWGKVGMPAAGHVACGPSIYTDGLRVTSDLDEVTCPDCYRVCP